MRKILVLFAAIGLVVAACGGDSGGSCESVADDAIQVIQEVINEMDSMTLEEAAALGDEEMPEVLQNMATRADELQDEATELGCSDATMEELLNARVGDLEADGGFGELIIDQLQRDGFFE